MVTTLNIYFKNKMNYHNMNKKDLLEKCLEFKGIQAHKEKAAEIAAINKMNKAKLLEKITELEKEAKLVEESKCDACLKEQLIQRKIDEKTYDERLLANMIRKLTCQHCNHEKLIFDEDQIFCNFCGSLQNPLVSHDKYH